MAWRNHGSPFHSGEIEIQQRLGVADQMDNFGRKVIRDYMPDQHQEFYAEQSIIMLGITDDEGHPWATLRYGNPGFIDSPHSRLLHIDSAAVPGDPTASFFGNGKKVGALGINFAQRRRNRVNGVVSDANATGFGLKVDQAFGNCPQYIQSREIQVSQNSESSDKTTVSNPYIKQDDHINAEIANIINRADTFFIASTHGENEQNEIAKAENVQTIANDPILGTDVSHRGGKPGFVQVEGDKRLIFPDFSGNLHFNTLGNILCNGKAGLLFIDFDNEGLVYIKAKADIIWEGDQVDAFEGAHRMVSCDVLEVIYLPNALGLDFHFNNYSPILEQTGDWDSANARLRDKKKANRWQEMKIARVVDESDKIKSFYMQPKSGETISAYSAGQFLPTKLSIPSQVVAAANKEKEGNYRSGKSVNARSHINDEKSEQEVVRTYTVSNDFNTAYYRLSIKREAQPALFSNWMHDNVQAGSRIKVQTPRGKFVLDETSERPVVLLSAGVGITPMISMLESLLSQYGNVKNADIDRKIYFVHVARSGKSMAFAEWLRERAEVIKILNLHIHFGNPSEQDLANKHFNSSGRFTFATLQSVLPLDDYDYYLCGPTRFMQTFFDELTKINISEDRIHYESFGPATVMGQNKTPEPIDYPPVVVRFERSDVEAVWDKTAGTLLEFAESHGVNWDFSCRNGQCGTCAAKIKCGDVHYPETPIAPVDNEEVLLCCSVPVSAQGDETCGEQVGMILDI